MRDVTAGRTRLVSTTAGGIAGDGYSERPQLRADGRAVVFVSRATNLVAPDANGDHWDIFHKDLVTGAITRVSQDAKGVQFPGDSVLPALSRDGRKVAFTVGRDSSFVRQIHVKDLVTGALTLVSADSAGTAGWGDSYSPSFSPSGRLVMFISDAPDLVEGCGGSRNVFVKDLASAAIWCLTRPDGTPMLRRFGAVFEAEFTPGGRGFAISTTAQLSGRDKVKNVADVYVGRFTAAFVAEAKP
ncbi:translocation protein TolB [Pleomorphomonas sp. SM30]|nr:translocation protein TolB [Pleomorphomonas sp. SM30]